MGKIKFTELLLQEAYKVDNVDDFINVIKSNNFGVKIPQCLKDNVADEENLESFKNSAETVINVIEKYGIKKVQGLQALCNLLTEDFSMKYIADKIEYIEDTSDEDGIDALMLLLKYWNSDFLSKPNPDDRWEKRSIKERLMDAKEKNKLDTSFLADLSEDIYDGVYSHGSNSKGSGDWKDVVMLYPRRVYGNKEKINPWEADENGWQLFTPWSFDGERAIAWYGTDPKNMKPTEWCTRARVGFYRNYTRGQDGYSTTPLYVIRNIKTGHSWQCAIQQDDFAFLNELDKPDRYTEGDLSIFPDELLKEVEDDFVSEYGFGTSARSLYDYKMYLENLEDDPEFEDNKNYIKEPFIQNDVNCKTKPILGTEIAINPSDFGIQEGAIRSFDFHLYPILNATGTVEDNDSSDLSLNEFFEHDYEYGYEHRSLEEDDEDGEVMCRMHNYGRKGGKFWRLTGKISDYDNVEHNVYLDFNLCNGQHVFGIRNAETNDILNHNELTRVLYDNANTIANKIVGRDKSLARGREHDSMEDQIRESFKGAVTKYLTEKSPAINDFFKKHTVMFDGKECYLRVSEHPSFYGRFGHPRVDNHSGYAVVRGIDYPTSIDVGIIPVDTNDKDIKLGEVHFGRKSANGGWSDVPRWQMLTDVDTLVTEVYEQKWGGKEADLDFETTKTLYNFFLGAYAVMRKSISNYLKESINSFFEEVYRESL